MKQEQGKEEGLLTHTSKVYWMVPDRMIRHNRTSEGDEGSKNLDGVH